MDVDIVGSITSGGVCTEILLLLVASPGNTGHRTGTTITPVAVTLAGSPGEVTSANQSSVHVLGVAAGSPIATSPFIVDPATTR